MTETAVYVFMGIIAYTVAYAAIVSGITVVWQGWAKRKLGPFWEYSMVKSIELYYPRWYDFVLHHRGLYYMMYFLIWPVFTPIAFTMITKVVNRCSMEVYGN